jgi:hypothetical protein
MAFSAPANRLAEEAGECIARSRVARIAAREIGYANRRPLEAPY